jgi:hypothetical protein
VAPAVVTAMKFIPDNMNDVWTILSGIDGSVTDWDVA